MPGSFVIDTTVVCFGVDGRDSATGLLKNEMYIFIEF